MGKAGLTGSAEPFGVQDRQSLRDAFVDVVAARMARSAEEMSHWSEYDYVIINNEPSS